MARRRACRGSPLNSVVRKVSTMAMACSGVFIRAPMDRTWALLCVRASSASSTLWASAARIPRTLFAAICSPLPDPPSTMPNAPRSPDTACAARRTATGDLGAFGIVLGGSGNGEQMAANKVRGIRAALAYNVETAELARTHNDAQVLSIGARMNTLDEAKAMAETFLTTTFSGDARHARR